MTKLTALKQKVATISVLGLILLWVSGCVSAAGIDPVTLVAVQDSKGKSLLYRSIRSDHGSNVVGIFKQILSKGGGSLTVKIQRSIDGKLRDTIVAPLREQGQETIDDQKRMSTVLPCEKMVLVQPSTRNVQDSELRVTLLERNYLVSSEKGPVLSGRPTVVVKAMSKSPELGGVRIAFDEASAFPLRKEIISGDGEIRLDWEVISISFPKTLDESVFRFNPSADFETINYSSPVKIRSAKEAFSVLGFMPSVPTRLPFGFAVQSMSTTDSKEWKALNMRITDGMKRLTVYQWKPKSNESIRSGQSRSVDMIGGIKIMVVGDLDESMRQIIIEAFQRQARLNAEDRPVASLDGI